MALSLDTRGLNENPPPEQVLRPRLISRLALLLLHVASSSVMCESGSAGQNLIASDLNWKSEEFGELVFSVRQLGSLKSVDDGLR